MLSAEALDTDGLPDSFPYWAFWQERCATLLPRPWAFPLCWLLPRFVDQARGQLTLQILQLGILFALMSWCSDSTYALIAGTVAERIRGSLRVRRIQRNVSGGGLIALGLASAFSGARWK